MRIWGSEPGIDTILRRLLDLFLPPRCHGCGGPLERYAPPHLCDRCRRTLVPVRSPLCTVCGLPFPGYGGGDHPCGDCIRHPPHFEVARSAFAYEGGAIDLIHDLKYGGRTVRRRVLAELLWERLGGEIGTWGVELVVPVPLHPSRLKSRGFNQSVLIGEVLARHLQIPLCRTVLVRSRETPPQTSLSREERLTSLRNAFVVRGGEKIAGKTLLLLDDVMTTGSTLDESARTLVAAGASRVCAVTVARTVPGAKGQLPSTTGCGISEPGGPV